MRRTLLQERLGVELVSLIEDRDTATVDRLVEEAAASAQPGSFLRTDAESIVASPWFSRSPVSVRLRLFCLPYAGGVSENVFAKYGRSSC